MGFRFLILIALSGIPLWAWGQTSEPGGNYRLDQPGVLIITAASDTTEGFQWQPGPGPDRISLVWECGVLSVPSNLAMDGYANLNLGIPLVAGFSGSGKDGPLVLDDGVFKVNENLMMSDGVIQLMVSDGELEIYGPRFRYTRPGPQVDDPKADYVFIAGILLLIGVLLRRARKKLRKDP